MKILIIYATAGAGHFKAAQYIFNGLKDSGHETLLVDSLDYTSPFYKNLYSKSYTFMITKVPWFWASMFYLIDIPFLVPLVRLFRRISNALNGHKLHRFLIQENFDYIFSTHFFSTEVAAYLKRNGKIDSTLICDVTDFDVHSIWLAKGVDAYTVACGWTREKLKNFGVPDERIKVTGIPVDKKFSTPKDVPALKQNLGVKDGVFTVLIATGSFGIGPIAEIIHELEGFQIMVVCGHNKNLYARLSKEGSDLVKIYGLVDNMDELMAASDAMITKPGGLSTSEALISGLALIFFSAIPGQETNNIKVLKHYGLGISGVGIAKMAEILKRYRSSPEELDSVRERTKALAKPAAVQDIINLIK